MAGSLCPAGIASAQARLLQVELRSRVLSRPPPLLHEGQEVGVALRTRTGISPVFVSIGHRMDLETAVSLVLRVSPCYRIPEPIRRAHRLSNQVRAGSYS